MSKFRGIIYKTTCLKNRMSYVGKQINFKGNRETKYLGSNEELQNDIKRLGSENFKKKILVDKFFKNEKELDELETEYIIKEKTLYPNGYNRTKRCWPPDLAARSKGGKKAVITNKRNGTGVYDPKSSKTRN